MAARALCRRRRRTGRAARGLQGTTQNDIIKEYLARGTYIFPPSAALRLTTDTIAFTTAELPKWNPINLCSYHLQEAGAERSRRQPSRSPPPIAVLDAVQGARRDRRRRISQGGRPHQLLRQFRREIHHRDLQAARDGAIWDEITRERYGVEDPKLRLFRYGVQVNSLGLTEQQPENNVYRILFGMLGVTLSKNARARAVQLPAWNEALGLPRPWDQQWSLRLQQIGAYETDMLDYGDIFDGSHVIEEKVAMLAAQMREEIARIEALGGAGSQAALEYMKERLVRSNAARVEAIETDEDIRVGVNAYTETEPSPLTAGDGNFVVVDPNCRTRTDRAVSKRGAPRATTRPWRRRSRRSHARRRTARTSCRPRSPARKAGVTTGEWSESLRRIFGEYRGPTGVAASAPARNDERIGALREEIDPASESLGRRLTFLVAKPGLDGHSNGAEQIAIRARDAGMSVIYNGIRFTRRRNRGGGAREGAACRSGYRSCRARMCRWRAKSWKAGRRGSSACEGCRRRHHSAGGRSAAEIVRRRRRLQSQGLRSQRHHARDRHGGDGRLTARAAKPDMRMARGARCTMTRAGRRSGSIVGSVKPIA